MLLLLPLAPSCHVRPGSRFGICLAALSDSPIGFYKLPAVGAEVSRPIVQAAWTVGGQGGERCRQVAHAPGQLAHWPNRGRVGSMRALGTWSTQERTSTSRSVPGKARIWRVTP